MDIVEGRHIRAGHLRQSVQPFRAGHVGVPDLGVDIHEVGDQLLAVADQENVGKIGNRFGIEEGDRPADKDERIAVAAIFGVDGDAGHPQHVDHVQKIHLERDRKSDEREGGQRRGRFQRHKLIARFGEDLAHVIVGHKGALAAGLRQFVKQPPGRLIAQ